MAKILSKQIIRFDGKNTFFEVMANGLSIDKVQVNFRQYDVTKTKGNKIIQQVDCYISVEDALLLTQDILSGKINALAEIEKKKGNKYSAPVWQSLGGMSAEKAKEKGVRKDGKALSRVLKLSPGSSKPFIFTAECGAGETSETGLIKPSFGTNPEVRIIVALTGDQLKQLALMINLHLNAFYSAQYSLGKYEVEFSPNK